MTGPAPDPAARSPRPAPAVMYELRAGTASPRKMHRDDRHPAWRRWLLARGLDQYDTDAGPLVTNMSGGTPRPGAPAPRRAGEPGRGLVTPAWRSSACWTPGCCTWCSRPRTGSSSPEARAPAAQVQALALDVAMIIFSVLALGLARKGLGAPPNGPPSWHAPRRPRS